MTPNSNRDGSKTLLLFDGECLLCNKWVRFLRRVQKEGSFEFAHIESDFARPIIEKFNLLELDSVIVIDNGKAYLKSKAILRIATKLKAPYSWAYILVIIPNFIRDWMYDIIARNRQKWFGRSDQLTCEFLVEKGDGKKDKPMNS